MGVIDLITIEGELRIPLGIAQSVRSNFPGLIQTVIHDTGSCLGSCIVPPL
jgi:hypothetical protein